MKRTLWGLVAIVGLVGVACSPTSLDSTGDRSTGWIGDVPATEVTAETVFNISTVAPVEAVALTSAGGMDWANDQLASVVGVGEAADPSSIAARIWRDSTGVDSFVQAPRVDIAGAIPGIKFPGAVPSGVDYVTSQLVFQTSGGRLGDPWFAAFGLWTVPPYSERRDTGQSAVLLVGPNPDPGADPPTLLCAVVQIADALSCDEVNFAGNRGALAQVDGGIRLQWDEGAFRYQLFYRDPPDPGLPGLVAGSMVLLGGLEDQAFEAFRLAAESARRIGGASTG